MLFWWTFFPESEETFMGEPPDDDYVLQQTSAPDLSGGYWPLELATANATATATLKTPPRR